MIIIRRIMLSLIATFIACSFLSQAGQGAPKNNNKKGNWQTKFRASRVLGTRPLPKNSLIESLENFTITGAHKNHSNRLNKIVCDGQWGISQGALTQISGREAAIKIGRAENFELEMGIQAKGYGGWFILFGFDQGHGFGIYNVTMKTSRSPWFITEFRDNKGIMASDQELISYEFKGKEALRMKVLNNKVTLTIGNQKILDNIEFAGIHEGDIILGTYDTQYGPKPVKIYGIRLRTLQ